MATNIMSILAAPLTDTLKWVLSALKRQVSYLTKYNKNMENLQKQATDLQRRRNGLRNLLEEAERRLEEPDEQVVAWLNKTDNIQMDVANLNQEAQDQKRCLRGMCPDLGAHRHGISKLPLKKLTVIKELQEEERNFRRISHVPRPPSIEAMAEDWVEGLESRNLITNKIIDAFRNDNIRSIGVYGMGGSGKTTLMKSINNKLQKLQLFKKVIILTVTQVPDSNKMQNNIAERLGLELNSTSSEQVRSNKLLRRLKNEEPVLIILDDVWKKVNLAEIGIPCGNEHFGCKIIVITRDRQVCNEMGIQTQCIFKMELLSGTESWTLFQKKAGDVVTHPNVEAIAMKIAIKCKGSPLAISTIGSSMRGEDGIHRWKHTLNVLKNPYPSGIHGVMPEVTTSLKHSYDRLPGREIKLCFLFCSLFPEDWNIKLSKLRDYGIGEGFLKTNGYIENASNELLHYIQKLKNCCLLMDGERKGHVKLHDVVRDVALWIAANDENGFLVNGGIISRNWFEVQKLGLYKRISFMNIKEDITVSVPSECPQLRTLLIRACGRSTINQNISSEMMTSLLVLDLKGTFVESSPMLKSLGYLTNLRTLRLNRCDVSSSLSVLGGMCNLEILSLRHSKIGTFPQEIGNLTNLKRLDLTAAKISAVAPKVFSKLSKLEELYGWNDFENWNKDVLSLGRLSHLEIRLRECGFEDEGTSLSWDKLKHFHVVVNDDKAAQRAFGDTNGYTNYLHIERINRDCPIQSLFKLTHHLSLKSCYGLENVVNIDEKGGFKHLEFLSVVNCSDIENIISIHKESLTALQDSLQFLKRIHIDNLENLKKIFHGPAPDRLLRKLEYLECSRCPKLANVFSSNTLLPERRLDQLVELRVKDCIELQEVFSTELVPESERFAEPPVSSSSTPTGTAIPMLSGLRRIKLNNLPKMRIIWNGSIPVGSLENLQKLSIMECDGLQNVFSSSVAEGLRNLERLSIRSCDSMEMLVLPSNSNREGEVTSSSSSREKSRIGKLISTEAPTIAIFQNLQRLEVYGCHKLKKLFSFNEACGLQKLRILRIWFCDNLEEIVGKEDEQEKPTKQGQHHGDFLPQLENLRLISLPNLTSIHSQGTSPLLNGVLKCVYVRTCLKLRRLPLHPRCASPILEKIQGEKEWFEGLVWGDESLKSLFQPFFREWPVSIIDGERSS